MLLSQKNYGCFFFSKVTKSKRRSVVQPGSQALQVRDTPYKPALLYTYMLSFYAPFVAVKAGFPQGKSLLTKTCIILIDTRQLQLLCISKFISSKYYKTTQRNFLLHITAE